MTSSNNAISSVGNTDSSIGPQQPQDDVVPDQEVQANAIDDTPLTPISTEAQDIEYRYLTFETEVPITPVLPSSVKATLPPCPNLRKYDNPFTWSRTRKNLMTYMACSVNITAAYAAGSYAAPTAVLTEKWGISEVAFDVGITLFTVGFGTAPMVLAPFSEINGRRPVFIVTGILFVVCQLCTALTESFGGMLAARLCLGIGGSTFSTMVGGILADIWTSSERNTPMVLFSGATLFGTGLGPLVSGFVAQNVDWRWVFYIQVITSGILVALIALFFKETRGGIILSHKAKAINKWYEKLEAAGALGVEITETDASAEKTPTTIVRRLRWKVKSDEERDSLVRMISLSLYRPFHLLVTEPVVFWFSAWISFSWAVLYLQFGSIPLVYQVNHGFDLQQSGAVFGAMCIGAIISTVLSIYQEKAARKRWPEKIDGSPEGRLYFACVESALMPIGLFWFGWTCYPQIHWIVPTIAVGVETMGIFSIYLATFNYTADVYQLYASSALAASNLCRNLLGGSFPLVTKQMFRGMGFQAASSLLGAVGAALTLVPWVLVLYGPRIRARSKIAVSLDGEPGAGRR